MTYQPVDATDDLQQGDLLERTAEILHIMEQYHSYFVDDKYSYFMILTQSCDLALRNGECKAPYTTLCAVRPVEVAVERELERILTDEFSRRSRSGNGKEKEKLLMFLERLLNNNEPEYFYLHEDAQLGLGDRYCAMLRLNVPLRTKDHYETCRSARILTLSEAFRAKLGWLVGDLFGRVGTEDWPKKDMQRIQDELIRTSGYLWTDERKIQATRLLPGMEDKSAAELQQIIKKAKLPNKKQEVLAAILEELKEHLPKEEAALNKIKQRLSENTIVKANVES